MVEVVKSMGHETIKKKIRQFSSGMGNAKVRLSSARLEGHLGPQVYLVHARGVMQDL